MKPASVETLSWVLIFGGLLVLSLGYFVTPRLTWLGAALMLGGGVTAAAGAVLIHVRSRMREEGPG
jgi:drug/metabolite transporter (DMT)-like permease